MMNPMDKLEPCRCLTAETRTLAVTGATLVVTGALLVKTRTLAATGATLVATDLEHPQKLQPLSAPPMLQAEHKGQLKRTAKALQVRTTRSGRCFPMPSDIRMRYFFFPRVRTPCGHGAQVIIEGREVQSDGGEKNKDNPTTNQTNQTTANHSPQAESPPSCSLSSVLR